jgi:hypothetical protein
MPVIAPDGAVTIVHDGSTGTSHDGGVSYLGPATEYFLPGQQERGEHERPRRGKEELGERSTQPEEHGRREGRRRAGRRRGRVPAAAERHPRFTPSRSRRLA